MCICKACSAQPSPIIADSEPFDFSALASMALNEKIDAQFKILVGIQLQLNTIHRLKERWKFWKAVYTAASRGCLDEERKSDNGDTRGRT